MWSYVQKVFRAISGGQECIEHFWSQKCVEPFLESDFCSAVLLLGDGGEGVGYLLLLAPGTGYYFEFFLAACFLGGWLLVAEAVGFACCVL